MHIVVIGCGVMGNAFARHFAKEHSVFLCDKDEQKSQILAKEIGAQGGQIADLKGKKIDVVLLAIKPKDLKSAAQELGPVLRKKTLLISILAGTTSSLLRTHFPTSQIVRCMPNLGLVAQQGVIGLVDDEYLKEKETIDRLLNGMGLTIWMPESKIDALTALSGSGIGFVLVLIEAMIDAGVHLGFHAQDATEIVLQTFVGAVSLLRESGKHPAELKLQISSPGGTTIAGLNVMEETGVRSGIIKTLIACYEKAKNMMNE